MYHFVVDKATQNILCYSDKDNSLVATSASPFLKSERYDFWTSIKIGEELFDLNIYFDEDEDYNADVVDLYPLILNKDGNYENELWSFEKFPLKFNRK